jgi:outer membrane autotransporter protein
MFGALVGEHLMYSSEGTRDVHRRFWNAIDQRRNNRFDLDFDVAGVAARRPGTGSANAYGDLVPPNCYPSRTRGRTVRDRNGGFSFLGGNSTVWADYLGSWAKQSARSHIDGYKTHVNGFALGYEYRLGSFSFGAAASYAKAHTEVSDYNQRTTTDALNLALYADYNHQSGFFGRLGAGFSHGWNDYTARGAGYHRSGDFNNLVWNLYAQVGFAIRTGAVNIIPSLGFRFSHFHQASWRDHDKTTFGLDGDTRRRNEYAIDLPLEVRVTKTYNLDGIQIAPEGKLGVVYAAKKNRPTLGYGLAGASGHYTIHGVDNGRTSGVAGLGVKAKFNQTVEAGLEYNFEFAKRFRQHSLTVGVGVSF